MNASPSRCMHWPSLLALGLALALLLGLGTWQLQRKQWKAALLADIAARSQTTSPVERLPGGAVDAKSDYTRVRLNGSFIRATERYVFISVPRQSNGIGGPGYWLFQQFEHAGERLYVNRGFIPEADKGRDFGAPANVTIEGLFRLPEVRGRFSNANHREKNVYYVRAPMEFEWAFTTGYSPIRMNGYVDMSLQVRPPQASPLPLPLVGKITIPNRHLEYALTWYALAATLLAIAIARARALRLTA